MAAKTIFLVGAPPFSSLRWDECELLNEPIPPFHNPGVEDAAPRWLPETYQVKWRLLPALAVPETPRMKDSSRQTRGAQFFTTDDLAISEDSVLSRFYDHSFSIHETSEISVPGTLQGASVEDSSVWTESTVTSVASNADGEITAPRLSIQGGLTDLQDLPNAEYLHSIAPQTMTVNLIVAVMATRPPRRIVTRQWKRELDLVEIVVGDETRSGFGVTFWLPPADGKAGTRSGNEGGEELRKSLALLRPRDIVLLRTVGLSCFRERVYGQSLRKGLTKIDLLHRQQVDATDSGGTYRLRDILNHAAKNDDLPLMKVRKVREWIRRFVDAVPDSAGGGTRGTVTLPPDTQEAGL